MTGSLSTRKPLQWAIAGALPRVGRSAGPEFAALGTQYWDALGCGIPHRPRVAVFSRQRPCHRLSVVPCQQSHPAHQWAHYDQGAGGDRGVAGKPAGCGSGVLAAAQCSSTLMSVRHGANREYLPDPALNCRGDSARVYQRIPYRRRPPAARTKSV